MGSTAKSIPTTPGKESGNRVKLTVPVELAPLPRTPGVWSQGPVYKRLDSDFLQRPLIPRAPPTPRLRIDQINGSLRVFDPVHSPDFSESPETVSLPQLARPLGPPIQPKPKLNLQVMAVLAGFAAGLAAAILLGWL